MIFLYLIISVLISLAISLAYVLSFKNAKAEYKKANLVKWSFFSCLFLVITLIWPLLLIGINIILLSSIYSKNTNKRINEDSSIK